MSNLETDLNNLIEERNNLPAIYYSEQCKPNPFSCGIKDVELIETDLNNLIEERNNLQEVDYHGQIVPVPHKEKDINLIQTDLNNLIEERNNLIGEFDENYMPNTIKTNGRSITDEDIIDYTYLGRKYDEEYPPYIQDYTQTYIPDFIQNDIQNHTQNYAPYIMKYFFITVFSYYAFSWVYSRQPQVHL